MIMTAPSTNLMNDGLSEKKVQENLLNSYDMDRYLFVILSS